MKLQLVNLLLFSDKRKNFLLLLAEGPKNIDDIPSLLEVPRISLLPQIKKLKDEGLVVQEEDMYRLSFIGEILIKKALPLLDSAALFEAEESFWNQRKLDSIPFHLLKRIGEIKGSRLVEPGIDYGFDPFPELVNYFSGSVRVMLLFSYFHPELPTFSLGLAEKGVELQLVLSRDVFERFSRDFRNEGEKLLAQKNASLLVQAAEVLKTPAMIAVSENTLFLGLFNTKERFEGQYLLSFEPRALSWGKELFEYHMADSRKISSMDVFADLPDDSKASENS